jgi:hypothetical protein
MMSAARRATMQSILRGAAAAIGAFGLALQFLLMVQDPHSPRLIASTVNFFSYFTILANILAVFAMLAPLVMPDSYAARFFSKPSARTATASYLIIVGGVYFVYLRHLEGDLDWELIADHVLHYATPVLFAIDWLLFVPRGQVRLKVVATSLIVPVLYGIWTIVHGALTNWYPYSFFDVLEHGYPQIFANSVSFMSMFIAVGLALVAIDRMMGSFQRQADRT